MRKPIIATLLMAASFCRSEAQIYDTNNVIAQTFAGSGFYGYLDGVGQLTMFYNPAFIVSDSHSNLFVWDANNYRIRKITPDSTVSTFAGGGEASLPGYGTNVALNFSATSMAIDHLDTIWVGLVSDSRMLLRIRADGYVSVISSTNYSTSFRGVCADSANNIYISDGSINKIFRYRTNGVLEVFAGSGNPGSADGNGIFTSFNNPATLAVDNADNVYVWDWGNHLLRRINQNRDVVTIAGNFGYSNTDGQGTNASFATVNSMCADGSGNIILGCETAIRKMSPETNVTTIAGSFNQAGYANGPGYAARFNGANGVCVSQGMLFVADTSNQRIRQISFDPSPEPVLPANLFLSMFPGLQITGTIGRTYQIQSSPDMNVWTPRATVLLTSSPYLWIDANPAAGNHFYRALLLP